MRVVHPTKTVYKLPQGLFNAFNRIENPKGTAMLIPVEDPDGNYIIGNDFWNDPDWAHLNDNPLYSVIADRVEEIPYVYWEESI